MHKEYPSIEEVIELIHENKPVVDKILVDDIEILIPESSERKEIRFIRCDFENSHLIIKNNEFNKNTSVSFLSCTFKKTQITLKLQNIPYLSFSDSNIDKETDLYLEVNNSNINFSNTTLLGNIHGFLSEGSYIWFSGINNKSKKQTGKLSSGFVENYKINDCYVKELRIESPHENKCSIRNLKCDSLIIEDSKHLGEFLIEECNFIKNLQVINSSFESITSFQNTTVNTIKLDKVQFNDLTYFDDFEILDYKNCDRKTIRTIKQELQKTENRIDYDTFRSYELELYKDELAKTEKWWHFKDLFILSLNSLFSKHGTSWRRSIGMTVLFSLGFYTVLYIIKNLHNDFNITLNGINHFTNGYFKFFLITNFYDPLSENREYLKYFGEWLPFIFGKIVIGYGLYETVQSFRKYKK